MLGTWRDDAEVLRRHGDVRQAEQLERCAGEAGAAAEEYIRWLTEEDAMLRSGRSRKWLRRHFPEWEHAGQARRDRSRRFYRMLIVPQHGNTFGAREAGRDAGLEGGRGA